MTHTKRCPYCKNVVGTGHGDPFKHLGSPVKKCSQCQNSYIDSDMIEWEISPWYRKLGYCFANNRIWLCLMPSLLISGMTESRLAFIFSFALIFIGCCLYVKSQVDEEIGASRERVKCEKYILLLVRGGYPVKKEQIQECEGHRQ